MTSKMKKYIYLGAKKYVFTDTVTGEVKTYLKVCVVVPINNKDNSSDIVGFEGVECSVDNETFVDFKKRKPLDSFEGYVVNLGKHKGEIAFYEFN